MAKTKDAMRIIDKMIGDDVELRDWIADVRASSEVAEMVYNLRAATGLTQQKLADLVSLALVNPQSPDSKMPIMKAIPSQCSTASPQRSTATLN